MDLEFDLVGTLGLFVQTNYFWSGPDGFFFFEMPLRNNFPNGLGCLCQSERCSGSCPASDERGSDRPTAGAGTPDLTDGDWGLRIGRPAPTVETDSHWWVTALACRVPVQARAADGSLTLGPANWVRAQPWPKSDGAALSD